MLIRREYTDSWSEFELDALWVGVRRHGQDNWESILEDPLMGLLKNKTPQDLYRRWEKETLKIFPSAVPLSTRNVLPPATHRSAPHALNRSGYSVADTTAMLMQSTRVPPHMSGIKRFPFGVENQSLTWRSRNIMPSLNNAGISGSSYIQGSSSRVSQMVATASAPQRASNNISMKPMASQLLAQTLTQRTNVDPKLMLPNMRMHALQTASETVTFTKRKSASTSAEPGPKLLLGGHFQLPKVVQLSKSAGNNVPGNTESNPVQVEADKEAASSSENTLSG